MSAVASGEVCAFGILVRRHQQKAWNIAWRFLGDRHQAEDVVQDAFLRVYKASAQYRPDVPFVAYLYKIVVRRCIDVSRKRRPLLGGLFHFRQTAPEDDAPEAALIRTERATAVRAAVNRLPDRQRMAVVLRYLEALDTRQTAEILDTTPKAVEQLLARARKAMGADLVDVGA